MLATMIETPLKAAPITPEIFKKVTGHSKIQFFCRVPHLPGYLDLKFHNLSPFGLNIRKIYRKYTKRGHIVCRRSRFQAQEGFDLVLSSPGRSSRIGAAGDIVHIHS